ncbi:immunity 49 family protein [Streptomyces sp. NPDC127063]|uniref:immunity 49 family protein n=1 Tax=Streptomyces sp. NPDC127063 TaxID=3347123 RepID=UPI0036619122
MTIKEVTRHAVAQQSIEQALTGMLARAVGQWHYMRYGDAPWRTGLRELGVAIADHVAARTLADPALETNESRLALVTAAECALGVLSLGCFPNGDQEILLPLVGEKLTTEELLYDEEWEPLQPATTARTWVTAFAWCVASGLVWEWERVIGLQLREDYAPAIRDGVPYSKRESISDPADLAEMDALCVYLTQAPGHLPVHWPKAPLCKPDAEERSSAARQLDHVDTLTPDQRLLRVLLDDDQAAFERALEQRLVEHRENVGTDPAPRTLLPVKTVALAVLASRVHGWQLGVRSAYLPESLLRASEPSAASSSPPGLL